MNEVIRDGKGHVIGRKISNGTLLDGKGHLVGRFMSGSNVTLDNRGRFEGRGNQTLRLLGNEKRNS